MMASNVSLLAELLESIFQENRELLLELKVSNVISSCKKEHPAIAGLAVDPDLHLDVGNIPDGYGSQFGLASLVFTIRDYLEVFIGVAESDARVGKAISGFVKRHEPSELGPLKEAFPDIFNIGAASPEAGLDRLEGAGKICNIFVQTMKKAFQGRQGDMKGAILQYLRQCASVKSVSDDLGQIDFADGITQDSALALFSDAVERLGISPELVKDVLGGYGSTPDDLGIPMRLFGGALSKTTTFGCAPVDSLLRDGLRRDVTMLLQGPAGVEKEILASTFVREGLLRNGCVIIIGTTCPYLCVKRNLESSGLDMASIESEGRLIFVDWHSRFTERVTSIDVSGNILKVSNDLTNLAVAIDMALRMGDRHPQMRLVMEMASPTIVTEGFDRVHEFLNSVKAKMKNHSCTGLVLLNPDMHPNDQISMLEEIFDGTMSIERAEQRGKFQSVFRISHLSGAAFSPARLSMAVSHRGLEISGGEDVPAETISFDHDDEKAIMGLLGIESLSQDGLPMGKSFLVWIPSTMMPADYVKPVVMEAQMEGHALLLALSSLSTDSIGEWMSEKGLSRKGLIDRGLLQIVDWYGQKSAKVLGMELDEGVIRTSRDLTHLGVGIDMALRKINDQFSSMAVMEVLSQAIRLFDLRSVYSFAQSINAKLADRGFTTFMLMERNAHDLMVNAAMEELFDGIIDIRQAGGTLELAIISIRGSHFQSEYRPLTKVRDRLTVDVSRS
ncbi:MAG: ATPase domain-containing protein, partial [Thermoplasmata archaeon]